MDGVREKILNAAGREFAEHGYKSTTIRRICRAADVNVAAVNYYFGDKQRLYLETVQQAHCRLSEQFPVVPQLDESPPEVKLHGFIQAMLIRMIGGKATPWEQRLMLREVLHPTSACRDLVEQYFRPLLQMLLHIIAELVPDETSESQRDQFAFSIFGQCLFYRIAGDAIEMLRRDSSSSELSIEKLADHITRFSLAGILGTSQSAADDNSAAWPRSF